MLAPVQSLWIGERLTELEQLCIQSFLVHGHPFHLYMYEPVDAVPAGVECRDAAAIVPRRDVFRHEPGGSYATFSNLFRYCLLADRGGWWVDCDVVCRRPFEFDSAVVIASEPAKEGGATPASCVLRAPAGHAAMRWAAGEFRRHANPSQARWGELGPRLIERLIKQFDLQSSVQPSNVFCPLGFFEWRDVLEGGALSFSDETCGIHLWNEMWRRAGQSKSPPSLAGRTPSTYQQLLSQFQVGRRPNRAAAQSTQDAPFRRTPNRAIATQNTANGDRQTSSDRDEPTRVLPDSLSRATRAAYVKKLAANLAAGHFPTDQEVATEMIGGAVVCGDRFDLTFTRELIELARSPGVASVGWDVRRFAALLLQRQLLSLPATCSGQWTEVLTQFGRAPHWIDEFGDADNADIVSRLHERLVRLAPWLAAPQAVAEWPALVESWIEISRCECLLGLARYLFTPDETSLRVHRLLRTTEGEPLEVRAANARSRAQTAIERLPAVETELLTRMLEQDVVYWVGSQTASEPLGLVEYPKGTVVAVVRPPGSEEEFEIKRVGRRGAHPVSVVFRRGEPVPWAHRFDGASMAESLQWEADQGSQFSALYEMVHDDPAPLSQIVAFNVSDFVPRDEGGGDPIHLLDYFTRAADFGPGFEEMRTAMDEVIEAFSAERGWNLSELDGPIGATIQLLTHIVPAQAIVVGTSSLRLDSVCETLVDDRRQPLNSYADRWKLDRLLLNVLGEFAPSRGAASTPREYVDRIFDDPGNRRRGDTVYLDLMRQAGRVWGTLQGAFGYSDGESFVARNVGLAARWRDGRWQVKLRFMDHDGVSLTGSGVDRRPRRVLQGMLKDEAYVIGSRPGRRFSQVDYLRDIYRVDETVERRGRTRLLAERDAAVEAVSRAVTASEPTNLPGADVDERSHWQLAFADGDNVPAEYRAAVAEFAAFVDRFPQVGPR